MSGVHYSLIGLCVAGLIAGAGPARAGTNGSLLVIHPAAWTPAVTNFMAFKTRLGFDVTNATTEAMTGGTNPLAPTVLRGLLQAWRTNALAGERDVYVLFVGDFDTIAAPPFQVVPASRGTPDTTPYPSDIFFSDLHTEFDRNGNEVYGEYADGADLRDFDDSTFTAVFAAISNDLLVGRIPVASNATAAQVAALLDAGITFEREVGARKANAILSAGRITVTNDPLFYADSWDYVVKDAAALLKTGYPDRVFTTVVHMDSNYVDRSGIDYAIEGDQISADYTRGQNLVRDLWETNDACSFLCNVSHGSVNYDFALRRNGAGLPDDVRAAVVISMSCASYPLGCAAVTNGVAVVYLGSVALVTPDAISLLVPPGGEMASARAQRLGIQRLYGDHETVGRTFREVFDNYVRDCQTTADSLFFAGSKPDILRNVVGFQVLGDPTLRHEHANQDLDELLDAEEWYLGTSVTNRDTDGDGLPDGLEFRTREVDPVVDDGPDVDGDGSTNADELLAGTDPFDAVSWPGLTLTLSNAAPVLGWDAVIGRLYQLQKTTALHPAAWLDCGTQRMGAGAWQSWPETNAIDRPFFYRLLIDQ